MTARKEEYNHLQIVLQTIQSLRDAPPNRYLTFFPFENPYSCLTETSHPLSTGKYLKFTSFPTFMGRTQNWLEREPLSNQPVTKDKVIS